MNYYYGVIHCANRQTALHLYDEYNGMLLENTQVELQLALVPDEVTFEQAVKDTATQVPKGHSFEHFERRLNRAFGHTNVKLTWEATDEKRRNKLQNGFTQELDSEDEAEYYKDLIGQSDDDDAEEQDVDEMRAKLLKDLQDDDNIEKEIDFDALNSDELDSEDLDRLEKGKGLKNKVSV